MLKRLSNLITEPYEYVNIITFYTYILFKFPCSLTLFLLYYKHCEIDLKTNLFTHLINLPSECNQKPADGHKKYSPLYIPTYDILLSVFCYIIF